MDDFTPQDILTAQVKWSTTAMDGPQLDGPLNAALARRFSPVDSFGDIINPFPALLTAELALGTYPHMREIVVSASTSYEDLMAVRPFQVLRSWTTSNSNSFRGLLSCEEGLVAISTGDRHAPSIIVLSHSFEAARTLCADLAVLCSTQPAEDETSVPMWFVAATPHGPSMDRRTINAPNWTDLHANYSSAARHGLDDLMKLADPTNRGRIILLHGDPGTGKTTAIRALAKAWKPWCASIYVLDQERLFADVTYLRQLVLDSQDEVEGDRWRLFIIEDADEIISADAKARTGQALSRLLNVSDGIIGQGLKSLFLISTNEPVSRLHPAVVRPGRCLADLEVGPLSPEEATTWLAAHGSLSRATQPTSLAGLYAQLAESAMIRADTDISTHYSGQYL
jgi:energy-coupling factor transporter ATP-binding protein EcfA2